MNSTMLGISGATLGWYVFVECALYVRPGYVPGLLVWTVDVINLMWKFISHIWHNLESGLVIG